MFTLFPSLLSEFGDNIRHHALPPLRVMIVSSNSLRMITGVGTDIISFDV